MNSHGLGISSSDRSTSFQPVHRLPGNTCHDTLDMYHTLLFFHIRTKTDLRSPDHLVIQIVFNACSSTISSKASFQSRKYNLNHRG